MIPLTEEEQRQLDELERETLADQIERVRELAGDIFCATPFYRFAEWLCRVLSR